MINIYNFRCLTTILVITTLTIYGSVLGMYELHQKVLDHTDSVSSLAFSSNGQVLVSGSSDGTVKIWHHSDNDQWLCAQTIKKNNKNRRIRSVSISSNGKTLAFTLSDNIVEIWNTDNQNKWHYKQTLQLNNAKNTTYSYDCLLSEFSSDGQTLAIGFMTGITIWKLDDTQQWSCIQTLAGHKNLVSSIAFSPDSKTLISGSWDKTIKTWRINDENKWENAETFDCNNGGHKHSIESISFSPQEQMFVSAAQNTIKIWEFNHIHQEWSCKDTIKGKQPKIDFRVYRYYIRKYNPFNQQWHESCVQSVKFLSSFQTFASSCYTTIKIWMFCMDNRWHCVQNIYPDTGSIEIIAFSPDGKTLAVGFQNGNIAIWNERKSWCFCTVL